MHGKRLIDPKYADTLAIGQAVLLIVISGWALAGRYPGSWFYIGLIGWCGLAPLLLYWIGREWRGFKQWLLCLTPWFLLIIQLVVGWRNPMWSDVTTEGAMFRSWQKMEPIDWLPLCYNPMRTQEYLWIFIGGLITATMVFTVIRQRQKIMILFGLIGVNGLAHALIGSWFKLTDSLLVLGAFEPVNIKFFSSFRYYNHWVAFGLLSLGAAVTLADYMIQHYNKSGWNVRGRQRWDLVWVAIASMIWIALPLSGSRSGMLFSALFIIGSGIYLAVAYRRRSSIFKHLDRTTRRILGGSLLGFLLIFSGIGLSLVWGDIMHRWERTQEEMDAGRLDQRFYASPRDCWKMVQDRPVWGWGIGSYAHVFFDYAGPEYRWELGKIKVRNEFAHNDWMQYWVELGTVGFLLLLSVPVGVVILTLRRPRASPECFWMALSIGLFLTFASFDFPFGPSSGIAIFSVCFAACARLSLGPGREKTIEELYAERP